MHAVRPLRFPVRNDPDTDPGRRQQPAGQLLSPLQGGKGVVGVDCALVHNLRVLIGLVVRGSNFERRICSRIEAEIETGRLLLAQYDVCFPPSGIIERDVGLEATLVHCMGGLFLDEAVRLKARQFHSRVFWRRQRLPLPPNSVMRRRLAPTCNGATSRSTVWSSWVA